MTITDTPPTMTIDPWEPIEGRCNGRKTDGTGLCRQYAGRRTEHDGYGRCYYHGGCAPSGRKNGMKLRALGEAGELLAECRIAVQDQTTTQAIQQLRTHAASTVMALSVLVDGQNTILGPDGRPHAYMDLYAEWVALSAKVEKVAADLGLEERRVQVDEAIATAVVATLLETYAELGQDPGPVLAVLGPKLKALDAVSSSGSER